MNSTAINFELPTFLIQQLGMDTQVINQEVRRMVALFLYEHQRISLSKACEIGGFTLWEFFELNRQLAIDLPYTADDLQDDLARLAHVEH